jgi:hypothetical protein
MGDVGVHERQCPGNGGIAQSGKPAGLPVRDAPRVMLHGLDEQQLRELGQDRR